MGRKIKKRQAGLGDGGRARMRHTAVFAPLTVRESLAPLKYKDDAWGARLFEQVLRCTRCLEMLQRKSHYFYQHVYTHVRASLRASSRGGACCAHRLHHYRLPQF